MPCSESGHRGGCLCSSSSRRQPGSRSRCRMRSARPRRRSVARNGRSRSPRSFPRLDSQLELLGFGLAMARRSLAEVVTSAHARDPLLELALVVLTRVNTVAVQRFVSRYERRKFGGKELDVVVAYLAVDLEWPVAKSRCACFARGLRGPVERFLAVGDTRQNRHAQHRRVDACVAKHPECPKPLPRRGRARICFSHDVLVHARDAEVDGELV